MQVEKAHPGATREHAGSTVYFCAPRCADKFAKDPARYATGSFEPMEPELHQIGLHPPDHGHHDHGHHDQDHSGHGH